MITTITLNPAIDKTLTIEKFELNKVNRVSQISEGLGGKGINVSKVLNYLGSENTALGFIGEKNYNQIQRFNLIDPIKTDFILVNANTRTNTKIIDPYSQTTTDINEAGFEVDSKQIDQMKSLIRSYSTTSEFMVFSGSVCKGMNTNEYLNLLKSVPSQQLVIDAEGSMLEVSLHAAPFLIKPNIHELETLLNTSLTSDESIKQACLSLIDKYQIQNILVSCGEDGSLLITKEFTYKANALKVDVVSTVGAGDSMLAAFLHNFQKTNDLKKACQFAACAGSLAVTDISTDAFKHKKIEDFLDQIHITTF